VGKLTGQKQYGELLEILRSQDPKCSVFLPDIFCFISVLPRVRLLCLCSVCYKYSSLVNLFLFHDHLQVTAPGVCSVS